MIKEYGNIWRCYDGDELNRFERATALIKRTKAKVERENPGLIVRVHRLKFELFSRLLNGGERVPLREYKTSVTFEIK